MIVYHSCSLHEGVADRAADELEAPFFQIFTHGVAFRGIGGDLGKFLPFILDRLSPDEGPGIFAECTEFFANFQIHASVDAHRIDLETIPDNPRILQNGFQLLVCQANQFFGIKLLKNLAVVLPPIEDGLPGQPGLGPFEDKELEQFMVVLYRLAPFLVMVGLHQRIFGAHPLASFLHK